MNADKVLHENVDCRIIMTEQHALGIDVGGSVIVRDPLIWHRMAKASREIVSQYEQHGIGPEFPELQQAIESMQEVLAKQRR